MSVDLKSITLKEWIWIVGAGCSVVGSWVIMGQDISTLKDAKAAQMVIDEKQDQLMKENKNEIVFTINRMNDEIKAEIRELRRELRPSK